jgi:NAD(P)-dependent dehydrogenase (short-subunit alcohol dehydrogenase family)
MGVHSKEGVSSGYDVRVTVRPLGTVDAGRYGSSGRAAQPVELAPLFAFLASNESRYVTGEVYRGNRR